MKTTNIYVHLPFCESKCAYCAFASFSACENEFERYFSALWKEIESRKDKNLFVKTIYFGGGTPSFVPAAFLVKTLEKISECFCVLKDAEIGLESNPNSLTKEKLEAYLSAGFNRISIGVQSLNNQSLKKIGRTHTAELAIERILLAKKTGFENINADYLLGLEGQSFQTAMLEINKLLDAGITHISCYMLMLEKRTGLANMVSKKQYFPLSDDESVDLYEGIKTSLAERGFYRYEVSNFAKSGHECQHNLNIWRGETYLGFGLSAHGYFDGVRYENHNNFEKYYQKPLKNRKKIDKSAQKEEFIMLSLRLDEGIGLEKYQLLFNENLLETKKAEIEFLKNEKLIRIKNNHLVALNFGVLNSIILKLI